MTKGLMKSSKLLQKKYRKQIKLRKDHPCHEHYVNYRNVFNRLKRKAKQLYYAQILNDNKSNLKKTWQILNSVIGKVNDKSNLMHEFHMDNKLVSDPQEIVNGFGKFFSEIGAHYASKIPESHLLPDYFCKHINPNSLFLSPTDEVEIQHIINSLKSKNSTGIDKISSLFLKQICHSILTPLTLLINISIHEGNMPDDLKIAKVVPIYKSGSKQLFTNYRPISILPAISKVMEKVIFKRLYHFLIRNSFIYSSQYGFWPQHSTIDAVTEFTKLIYET